MDSLADILDALGVKLADFFSDDLETEVVFGPEERIAIEGKGASVFELLVPGSTNNMFDPIMVELADGESLEPADPHPGELFGYVLSGTATLKFGKKVYRVPGKHCFYFKADRPYQIFNENKAAVKLLWITAPPLM